MFGMTIDAAKAGFFDTTAVTKSLDRAERANLSRAGAAIRTAAQRSLAYDKTRSAPGQPPHAHRTMTVKKKRKKTGKVFKQAVSPLRNFLFFSYDADRHSVVIGPVALSDHHGPEALIALEKGGTSHDEDRNRTIHIAARPFMMPAYKSVEPKIADMWRNSVRS